MPVGVDVLDEVADQRAADDALSKPLRDALESLPTTWRDILLLTELAGMTYPEIAAALGIAEGTVGSRRTRALALLRGRLDRDYRDRGGWLGLLSLAGMPVGVTLVAGMSIKKLVCGASGSSWRWSSSGSACSPTRARWTPRRRTRWRFRRGPLEGRTTKRRATPVRGRRCPAAPHLR